MICNFFFGSVHVSLHEVYNIYDSYEKRVDMEGGSEGDGEGRRGGGRTEGRGREKSSNCTLSFKGAKNFIPGKALFFLSLESSASTPLIAAAVHTHGYFHTAVCEDRRGILQSPAPTPTRPSLPPSIPAQPGVALRGPVPTANTAFPGAA